MSTTKAPKSVKKRSSINLNDKQFEIFMGLMREQAIREKDLAAVNEKVSLFFKILDLEPTSGIRIDKQTLSWDLNGIKE